MIRDKINKEKCNKKRRILNKININKKNKEKI